jgi:hypothetical protein
MDNNRYCTCRRCKAERRKGKILGTRPMLVRWYGRLFVARYDDYIHWPKFARKGSRRPIAKFNAHESC